MLPRPPRSTLFPYTTLFRSRLSEGTDPFQAAVDAARARFIPIAMTSLATIIGLLPTALGLEKAAEANRPLALAVTGGLARSEEHTSELQSHVNLVCRLLLEK